ncbi:MAG: T9SS type A sorting domain-containing protein [Spirosomataceae bacterium]
MNQLFSPSKLLKNTYLLAFFLFFFLFNANAQSLFIDNVVPQNGSSTFCSNQNLLISYSSNSPFGTGNKFTVQASRDYGSTWTEISSVDTAGMIKTVIPTSMLISSSSYYTIYLKITASSPKIESSYRSLYVTSSPRITLSGISKSSIVRGEIVNFTAAYDGYFNLNTTVVTSDNNIYNDVFNITEVGLMPQKTGVYTIKQISNACGIGTISGSANITVRDYGLTISSNNSVNACIGSTVSIQTVVQGVEPPKTTYLVRLFKTTTSYVELPATIKDNIVSFTLTDAVTTGYYNTIQILNATTKEEYTNTPYFNMYIYGKPSAEIITASQKITIGSTQTLDVQFTGIGPFSATLSDGQKITTTSYSTSSITQSVKVAPLETTSYSITSFTSGCNNKNGVGENKTVLSVTPQNYVRTDSVKAGTYCPLQTAEAYYTSNAKLAVGTAVTVVLTNYPYLGYNFIIVTGQVKDSKTVTFTLPAKITPTFSNKNVYAIINIPNYYSTGYGYNYLTMSDTPSLNGNSQTTINLSTPQSYNLNLNLSGGEPYTVLFTDSTKLELDKNSTSLSSNLSRLLNITQNKSYAIKSISNSCGTTNINGVGGYSFVVANSTSNSVELSSSTLAYGQKVCEGQKVKLLVNTLGSFDSNTSYTVELLSYATSTNNTVLATSKSKEIEVTIPTNLSSSSEYFLRVYTSNPLTYSNLWSFYTIKKPEIHYTDASISNLAVGNPVVIRSTISGVSPINITYSDNSTDVFTVQNSISAYYSSVSKTITPTQTVTFGIKSLSNMCGTTSNTLTLPTVTVTPFILKANYSGNSTICANATVPLSFTTEGTVPDTTTFSIQAAKTSDNPLVYKTIQTGIKANPMTFTIPSTFDETYYSFRLINGKGDVISNTFSIYPIKKATASIGLSSSAKETSIIYGNSVSLYLKTSNNNSYTHFQMEENGSKFIKSNVYGSISMNRYPKETTVYKLTGVTGQCGSETINDSVKVVVKPLLSAFTSTSNTVSYVCMGKPITLSINAQGPYALDNKFQVSLVGTASNGTTTKLATNAVNGSNTLTLPQNLTKGSYNILVESTNPALSYTLSNFILTTAPDLSLVGNNGQIINAGDVAPTYFKDNKVSTLTTSNQTFYDIPTTIMLSDSSKFFVQYWYSGLYGISLYPKKNTTYSIKSVSNACGVGVGTGSFKVIVNAPSAKRVAMLGFVKTKSISSSSSSYEFYSTICKGSTYEVAFTATGSFSPSSKFTFQMSDANGENFKELDASVIGSTSIMKVTIPTTVDVTGKYLFRVVASDTGSVSTTTRFIHLISEPLTARFETDSYLYEKDKTLDLKIKFSGTPPFTFTLGKNEIEANLTKPFKSEDSLYTFKYTPDANTTIRLFSVSNALCGTGIINNPSSVRLELITGIEELNALGIKLYPNPTSDKITIESDTKPMQLRLVDAMGTVLKELMIRDEKKEISLSDYPTGLYFLHINKENKTASFKILKL